MSHVFLTGASGTYQLQAADLSTDMTHAYKARTVDLKLTSSGGADLDGTFALSLTDLAGGLGLSGIPPDGTTKNGGTAKPAACAYQNSASLLLFIRR